MISLVEILLLAVALCVDSLVVSTTSAFKSRMDYSRGVVMAIIFALFQGGFPMLGALLGGAFKGVAESVDHWIAFGLLLLVGGHMIWDVLGKNDKEEEMDVTKLGVMCLLGIATSIDAFVVGIGLGLNSTFWQVLLTAGVIAVVTFLAALLGVFLGRRNIPIPERVAGVIAGLVLIGLGVHTLLEHLF